MDDFTDVADHVVTPTPGNKYLVGLMADNVRIANPPKIYTLMSKADALNLAAYLVLVSGQTIEDFRVVYDLVSNA